MFLRLGVVYWLLIAQTQKMTSGFALAEMIDLCLMRKGHVSIRFPFDVHLEIQTYLTSNLDVCLGGLTGRSPLPLAFVEL